MVQRSAPILLEHLLCVDIANDLADQWCDTSGFSHQVAALPLFIADFQVGLWSSAEASGEPQEIRAEQVKEPPFFAWSGPERRPLRPNTANSGAKMPLKPRIRLRFPHGSELDLRRERRSQVLP